MVKAAGKVYEQPEKYADQWQKLGFPSMEQFAEARRQCQAADARINELQATIEKLQSQLPAAETAVVTARVALLTAD